MKKILLLFCFAICASLSYGQVKVVSSGDTKVGDTGIAPAAKLHVQDNNNGGARLFVQNTNTGSAAFADVAILGSSGPRAYALQLFSPSFSSFTWNGLGLGDYARFRSASGVNGLIFTTGANKPLIFGTNDNERMRVEGGGDVGIGYTNPAYKLHVNGQVVASNVAASSDKRLKKNIKNLDYGLKDILKLEPVTFQYNGLGQIEDTDKLHFGLIAQELQKIMPELVEEYTMTEYSTDINQYGEDEGGFKRESVAREENYLLIRDSHIKYALINAVKEQQSLIDAQNDRIEKLEEIVSAIGSNESINSTNITLTVYDLAELGQNIPNPFRNSTNIDYVIPTDASSATINIYGQNGQIIKSLNIDHIGEGSLTVDADTMPSGTYTYQLVVDGRTIKTNSMIITQ